MMVNPDGITEETIKDKVESIKRGERNKKYFVEYYNEHIKDLFYFDVVNKCMVCNDKFLMFIGDDNKDRKPYYVVIPLNWFYTPIKELEELAINAMDELKISQKPLELKNGV